MPPRQKSTRRSVATDEDIRAKVLELAERFYHGRLAPNLSRFAMHTKGWPTPQTLLRQRGYAADAKGKYSDAWAELVRQLTGLRVYQGTAAKPPPAARPAPLWGEEPYEWYPSRQAALSEGLQVAS